MNYIATFFSHFGAIRYRMLCDESGVCARVMPVPRDLSSSCGSCVSCAGRWLVPTGESVEEVERIFACTGNGYEVVYDPENEH